MAELRKFSEDSIVALLQSNNQHSAETALQQIFDRYSPFVVSFLGKAIADQQTVSTLLLEIFAEVFRRRHQYSPDQGKLFTWIIKLTRAYVIESYEKETLNKYTPVIGQISLVSNNGLSALLDKLDTTSAMIIFYMHYEGYNSKDLSEMLKIPINEMDENITKAFKAFRVALKKGNSS